MAKKRAKKAPKKTMTAKPRILIHEK